MDMANDLLAGSRRALARVMTLIENDAAAASEVLAALFMHTGKAHIIGVTGAPGTGKSTLVNQLALELRKNDLTVGIVAVDPTSPFSGGAILGDRIRMRDLSGDRGVFIRSMATRGSLGGLALATADMIKALDAAGYDAIIIETVGAGQSEVDIARYAHTVIVVEAPGLGDDVQAIKAGILEIADILAVNKADDPRAKNTVRALRSMLELNSNGQKQPFMHHGKLMEIALAAGNDANSGKWEVPIQETNALTGEGVSELLDLVNQHYNYLQESGELGNRERIRAASELNSLLREYLVEKLLDGIDQEHVTKMVEEIIARRTIPFKAAQILIDEGL